MIAYSINSRPGPLRLTTPPPVSRFDPVRIPRRFAGVATGRTCQRAREAVEVETVNPEALVDGLEFLLVDAHALFDPLTGLPGPALVLDRIDVALARARRLRRRVGVFVLYDACVSGSRQMSVQALATMLRTDVRPDDTIARVASRTFVVVCNDLERDEDAERILERLLTHVDDACRIGVALGSPFDRARDVLARATNRAVTAPTKGRRRRWPVPDCRKAHFARRAG
jgi:hypothetical protein